MAEILIKQTQKVGETIRISCNDEDQELVIEVVSEIEEVPVEKTKRKSSK
jgi:hypothetical protein